MSETEKDRVPPVLFPSLASETKISTHHTSLEMSRKLSTNIFLIGFMGAGKSTVGRCLAQKIGFRFADLDQLIVEREGCSIPEIFSTHGEEYFRRCETAVLAEQSELERTIFATGGGIVGRVENRVLMKKFGRIVFLHASWPTLQHRISKGSGRPLANQTNGWEAVQKLWLSRLPWYEEADLVIDTDRLRINDVVQEIISRLDLVEAK